MQASSFSFCFCFCFSFSFSLLICFISPNPDYKEVLTTTLPAGQSLELRTINYPGYTYSDCQWVILTTNVRGFVITFLDFNITFGVSLTIGHGTEFIKENELFKIGSKDIQIEINDTVVVSTHVIWIWFRTNDPTTQVQTKTDLFGGKDGFEMDTVPYVRGIRLSITASEVGGSM